MDGGKSPFGSFVTDNVPSALLLMGLLATAPLHRLLHSPRYQVNRQVLHHTENSHAEISDGQVGEEEIRYRPQSP